ncbi:MAG: hypothetical protein IH801_08505, partial [Nitrospinae bacterium]|nr:hypothetical protein [Nitrospinota bacterium]
MMRQYAALKKQYPDCILFFRMGDFFEMFYEDAEVASRVLEITLTARHKESADPVPMAGVPHHSVQGYLAKMVQAGYRVAVCEQVEEAAKAKGLVRREVVRVVTPGTLTDEGALAPKENQYVGSIYPAADGAGLAMLDLSTGEFNATELRGERWSSVLQDECFRVAPKEVLVPEGSLETISELAFLEGEEEWRPLHFLGGNAYSLLEGVLEARLPRASEAPEEALAERIEEELELTREARERREQQLGELEREVEAGNVVDISQVEREKLPD